MKYALTALLATCLCLPLMGDDAAKKKFEETKAKAEKGDAKAQGLLAWEYAYGEKKDPVLAFEWAKKAAEQGDSKGEFILGRSFHRGLGTEQDFKEAVKWYRKAAEQGDADAQNNLGVMYGFGKGVPQDYVTAYAWYNIAQANGNAKANEWKGIVAKKMTPDQIAEGQKLSREMLKKNPKLLGE